MKKFKNSILGILLLGVVASFIANHFGIFGTINIEQIIHNGTTEKLFNSSMSIIFHPVFFTSLFIVLYFVFQRKTIKHFLQLRQKYQQDEIKDKELQLVRQYIFIKNKNKSFCLLLWGRNGIGKSTLLDLIQHSLKRSLIIRKLFFFPYSISNVFSISLIPNENLFEGLYRFFFFSKDDFSLNEMINQKENIKLDFLLHIIPQNSVILIDDISIEHSSELILFFKEIKKRKLKIVIICTSDIKFEISLLPEFFIFNENIGVSPLAETSIIKILEREGIDNNFHSSILSISDGNPGKVFELIIKLKNSSQKDIDIFRLMKTEHSFENKTINSFIEYASFVQSNDGVIIFTFFLKLNPDFSNIFDELISNSIIKPLDISGNYKLDKELELEFYKKTCLNIERKEQIIIQILNSFPNFISEIKQIDGYIFRNIKLILKLVSVNSQLTIPNEADLLSISKLFKNSIYFRDVFEPLIINNRLSTVKSAVHLFLISKYSFIDSKFKETIHTIENIKFEADNIQHEQIIVESNIILAECLRKVGNYSRSRDVIEKLLLQKNNLNIEAKNQSQTILGKAYIGLGMHRNALKAFNSVINSNIKINKIGIEDINTYIDAYRGKNIILRDQGKYDEALSEIYKLPNQLNSIYNKIPRGYVFRSISTCYKFLGKYSEATKFNSYSFDIADNLKHKPLLANCVWGTAEIYRYGKKYDKAIENYEIAITLYKELSDNQGYLYSLLGLADIYLKKENYDQCLIKYNTAEKIAKADHCDLELLYVEYGKSMLNYSLHKKVDYEKIIALSTKAFEKNIQWLKIHIDLFLCYTDNNTNTNFNFDKNWLEEDNYIRKIKKYKREKISPFKIIPQKY